VGVILTLVVKPQWVRYKLDETIEQPCSYFPTTHLRSVQGCSSVQRVFGYPWIIMTHGERVQPLQSVKLL
jgi:hypothetical protein